MTSYDEIPWSATDIAVPAKAGDVLVIKDGTLGVARIVTEEMPEFSIFVSVAMIRVVPELRADWLHQFFDSGQYLKQLGRLSAGSGLKHIHLEHFRKFNIPLPPSEEQEEICSRICLVRERLRAERQVLSNLRKQKNGVMHDLLTGKVEVKVDEFEAAHV